MFDDGSRIVAHDQRYAIIARESQVQTCDNRLCFDHANIANCGMDIETLKALMDARGMRQVDLVAALGIEQDKVSKVFNGKRKWQPDELLKILAYFGDHDDSSKHPDTPQSGYEGDYVDVPILPSFVGMGGGGTGDGDIATAKLSRDLIEVQLRGRAWDFELIDVRGDSMEPDFFHGDQILIDRRDRDPRQPGPFALWDSDGYVLKLVERVPGRRGWYKVFSANPRYSSYEVEESQAIIRGRPVWFARRI